jgi:thiol-disulfide isomerase/thioredoxin
VLSICGLLKYGLIFAIIELMKKLFLLFILFIFSLLFNSSQAQNVTILSSDSVLNLTKLKVDSNSNTTYIINFWATWCKPCVEELPYFKQIDTTLKDSNYHFIFISFDQVKSLKSVQKFVKMMELPGEHGLIEVENMNKFINSVSEDWSGGIPLTIVINKDGVKFHEAAFDNYKSLWRFIRD